MPKEKTLGPSSLTIGLFEPGMTPLHRAGLGGLAASLGALDRAIARNRISSESIPECTTSEKPWDVQANSLTLNWGKPENAEEFFKRLFEFSFSIKDGLIDLPGTYTMPPSRYVRNEWQLGLTLSFLQFGTHRKLSDVQTRYIDPSGDGLTQLKIESRTCSGYVHQKFYKKLVDSKSKLRTKPIEQPSAFCPGAVVRHVGFRSATRIERPVGHVVCSAFAIVGCLPLPIHGGMGVLLVPEISDLKHFQRTRPRLSPMSSADCRVASPSDGALQAVVRFKAKTTASRVRSSGDTDAGVRGINAMLLRPTPWNEKQKTRVDSIFVPAREFAEDETALRKFAIAIRMMPRKVIVKEVVEKAGRAKTSKKHFATESFFIDSNIRPLIADNLAQGRLWYSGFAGLLLKRNKRGEPLGDRIGYETNELFNLTMEPKMTSDDEMLVVKAIHRAVHKNLVRIYANTMGQAAVKAGKPPSASVKNRWRKYQDDTRRSLLNAKTKAQANEAVAKLMGRAGITRELQSDQAVRQFLNLALGDDWRRARDICLIALVSYHKPEKPPEDVPELEDKPELLDSPLNQ